ncbi:3-hydroxyacyl-CoA dehydrogenase family protein [Alicyclobacillus fastidiosus]|uniref:3-hydroxyacyl-CoA dehydrogenase family protein n=1 Tax=Alicyclobacillus fastidiosus TaxID=392011 RepID=A0ABV5AD24_9BACL|nr:3-hydroxyacyl-CoA dehydrogenase family protein [Alicyclobacillus fastidiosus]WEH08804.1 3-hydroxyacyl-CoA dehydrogenase family protein [Alicyclobacillus fastidiosus]
MSDVKQIAVVGAGQMGHQIAMLCALGGFETKLQDVSDAALSMAKESLEGHMARWVAKGRLSQEERDAAFARLQFTTSLRDAASAADLVIEAVVEKLSVKREVFQQLGTLTRGHTILATNSSTIVSSKLADVTGKPDKVCNMHFFFPPLVMKCVEVVMNEFTSQETADAVLAVCERIDRRGVLLRKEISGFVANRILGALQREAVALYEAGVADFKDIDTICQTALNHPIGPFALMDLSGLDVVQFVMQQQYEETGDEHLKPFAGLVERVEQGHLGRKTGKGWYDYAPEGGSK